MKLSAVIAAVLLALVAPLSGQQPEPMLPSQASESYVIVPLDILRFRIVGDDTTGTEVRVSSSGSVTLPYVGTVDLGGRTVSEAREYLYGLYNADYYVNPQIDLAVVGYKQRRVNVQGFVNRQGFVMFPPEEEMTLLGAIALAGGWRNDRMGNASSVKLTRTMPDGSTKEHTIDANRITQKDWPLQDGDYIFVPERRW